MSLFNELYNITDWLTQNREDAEDLVEEDVREGVERIFSRR